MTKLHECDLLALGPKAYAVPSMFTREPLHSSIYLAQYGTNLAQSGIASAAWQPW
jgi:hypothetical protein